MLGGKRPEDLGYATGHEVVVRTSTSYLPVRFFTTDSGANTDMGQRGRGPSMGPSTSLTGYELLVVVTVTARRLAADPLIVSHRGSTGLGRASQSVMFGPPVFAVASAGTVS